MKSHPIPADQTDWGGFTELFENNVAALHGILEEAAAQKSAPKGSPEQLVGDFYASAMDSARADKPRFNSCCWRCPSHCCPSAYPRAGRRPPMRIRSHGCSG